MALKDISFFYRDKTASVAPKDYTGFVNFTLPPQGIDVDVKVRLIPASAHATLAPVASGAKHTSDATPSSSTTNRAVQSKATTIPQRDLHRSMHVVENVSVSIAKDCELEFKESNHRIVLSVFKPRIVKRFKNAMERILGSQIQVAFEYVDGFAYDISKRAEVFADTGLDGGAAISAAFVSEIGRIRRYGWGRNRDREIKWRATGTGVVVEDQKVDRGTGQKKSGAGTIAVGAEPQILSGAKRGPAGTGSESVNKRLKKAADEMDVDVDMDVNAEDMQGQAAGVVNEGKRQAQMFKDAVNTRVEAERRSEGWQSSAYDVNF
jgi:hypothetical protein